MEQSKLAKNSLIFSLVGWFGYAIVNAVTESLALGVVFGIIFGIVGIVNGHKATKEISESETPMKGKGMAIAGLIIGYMVVIGLAGITIMFLTM